MSPRAKILPGCFAAAEAPEAPPMTGRGRAARLLAAAAFVAACLVVGHLGFPGGLATQAGAGIVLAWFGLSHAVAAGSGYRGCPELGAIASLFRSRPLTTNCTAWRRIDAAIRA